MEERLVGFFSSTINCYNLMAVGIEKKKKKTNKQTNKGRVVIGTIWLSNGDVILI